MDWTIKLSYLCITNTSDTSSHHQDDHYTHVSIFSPVKFHLVSSPTLFCIFWHIINAKPPPFLSCLAVDFIRCAVWIMQTHIERISSLLWTPLSQDMSECRWIVQKILCLLPHNLHLGPNKLKNANHKAMTKFYIVIMPEGSVNAGTF